mmetsp:Transcript_21116/g.29834  ORF Transcript_21116/g.29834 Transcript_21116/m.29834 type:complete len:200 (-) Transcript_21116:1284-1883(-)
MIHKTSSVNLVATVLISSISVFEIANAYHESAFVLLTSPRSNHQSRLSSPNFITEPYGSYYSRDTQLWGQKEEETSDLPSGFNPFKPQEQQASRSSAFTPGSVVNLRKIRMSSITSELIHKSTIDEMKESLLEHKDFLLEPLEEDDAVLDEDSIYTPGMTRDEKYNKYRESMENRLKQARDPTAKKVLTALMEFTLSYE